MIPFIKFPLFADIIDIFTDIFPFYERSGIYFYFLLNLMGMYGIIFINITAPESVGMRF